jgi:hypothetical protein
MKNSRGYATPNKDNQIIKYGATVIDETDGMVARIDQIFVHPFYLDPKVRNKAQYDGSIVKVVDKLMLSPGIAEAKPLADDSETYEPGEICVFAGFGVKDVRPRAVVIKKKLLSFFLTAN